MTIDIQAIREALPHRYPMLLVDRVVERLQLLKQRQR